jgi:hypothetical protein
MVHDTGDGVGVCGVCVVVALVVVLFWTQFLFCLAFVLKNKVFVLKRIKCLF